MARFGRSSGARGGGPIVAEIDPKEWRRLQRDLKRFEPEARKALNKRFKELLNRGIIPSAKRHASWSGRIPGAIKPSVTSTRVRLRVAAARAPHARPFEGISAGSDARGFRHPVFGNREVWVQQTARPFLKPAVDANRDEFMAAAAQAIDDTAKQTGWT